MSQKGFDRRVFLQGATAGGLALTFGQGAFAQTPGVRRNVGSKSDPNPALDTYREAVRKMLALPPEDPLNWYRQAIIHMIDCTHNNWWFLVWHRGYILHL
jgi:tyrosinase